MRTLRKEGIFDQFGLANWHGKDGAVEAAILIAILNRNDIELAAEEAQGRPTSVRRKSRERAHSPPDDTLTVASRDHILDRRCRDITDALGVGEAEKSVPDRQMSFGVLFDVRHTYDLYGLCRDLRWLCVAD